MNTTFTPVPEHVAALSDDQLIPAEKIFINEGAKIWPVVGKHYSKLYLQKGKIANKNIAGRWLSIIPPSLAPKASWFVERNQAGTAAYGVVWFQEPMLIGKEQRVYGFIVDVKVPDQNVGVSDELMNTAWSR